MNDRTVPAPLRGGRKIDRLHLLEQIDALGSINAAAKALGVTYKAAWEAMEAINNLSEQPLLQRTSGGKGGGGTRLTAHGRQALALFRDLDGEFQAFLKAMGGEPERLASYYQAHQLMRRWQMKSSARNQFLGRIQKVTMGAVNAEVILDIGGGDTLAAIITNTSVEHLGLEENMEAFALIKAPWVIVTTDETVRTSARNRLCGVVSHCTEGAVNGEVIIALPGGKAVAAIVTNDSIRSLGLQEGVRACALIKASHIILAVSA
jgi:molybdate transport system regulatory protein